MSDLLLSSGFGNPQDPKSDDDQTLQALHDAILDALLNGGVLSDEMLDQLTQQQDAQGDASSQEETRDLLEALIQKLIEQLTEQGYITMAGKPNAQQLLGPGGMGQAGRTRFHVTDKAIDFLGYRALRDLLGPWADQRRPSRHAVSGAGHRGRRPRRGRTNSATR